MKRSERICVITQILTNNPNKDYPLGSFAEMFSCAKSSISEDLAIVRSAVEEFGFGYIETTAGSKGGVRYVPYISENKAQEGLEVLRAALEESSRGLGDGFIYTSDLMFNPDVIQVAAEEFARKFASLDADFVITVETRGVGVAMLTAKLLHLPLIVLGREARIADGSTVSINYFSGSTDRIQKMSVSRRAIKTGQKAIIIDDFMRRGGSMKGIENMLSEFEASAVAKGVVIATKKPVTKEVGNYFPIMILDDTKDTYAVSINPELSNK